jgi:hypothetical protein
MFFNRRSIIGSIALLSLLAVPLLALAAEESLLDPEEYLSFGANNGGAALAPFKIRGRNLIVDNLNSFNQAKRTGTFEKEGPGWTSPCEDCEGEASLMHANGYYGCYDFITSRRCGHAYDGTETATWTPRFLTGGEYEVWVSFVCTQNRANPAIYEVHHAEGVTTFGVDQNYFECAEVPVNLAQLAWARLGTFRFNRKGGLVRMVNSAQSGHSECADAVGFKFISNRITVSGVIVTLEDPAVPVAGVTLTYGTGLTAVTNVAGAYSFQVDPGWSGSVTPVKDGYTFIPEKRNFADQSKGLINQNFLADAD